MAVREIAASTPFSLNLRGHTKDTMALAVHLESELAPILRTISLSADWIEPRQIAITSSYEVTNETVILADATLGAITVTLPPASIDTVNREIYIKKVDSDTTHAVTIARRGTDTIDGMTSIAIATAGETFHVLSDGVGTWRVLSTVAASGGGGVVMPASAAPIIVNFTAAAVGTSVKYAREDHRHLLDHTISATGASAWTGSHSFEPAANAVPVTIAKTAALTAADILDILDTDGSSIVKVGNAGNVGVNCNPDTSATLAVAGNSGTTGLVGWYKADSIVGADVVGGALPGAIDTGVDMITWRDQSGNSNDLTAHGITNVGVPDATRPQYFKAGSTKLFANLPSISFYAGSGSPHWLFRYFTLATPITLDPTAGFTIFFLVSDFLNVSQQAHVLGTASGGNNEHFIAGVGAGSSVAQWLTGGGVGFQFFDNTYPHVDGNERQAVTLRCKAGTKVMEAWYSRGESIVTPTKSGYPGDLCSTSRTINHVGLTYAGVSPVGMFSWSLAEIGIINRSLSDAEIDSLNIYANARIAGTSPAFPIAASSLIDLVRYKDGAGTTLSKIDEAGRFGFGVTDPIAPVHLIGTGALIRLGASGISTSLAIGTQAADIDYTLPIAGGVGILHNSAGNAWTWSPVSLTVDVSGTLSVASGGTGLTSGTSGGVLAFTGTTTLASSAALTANGVVLGGGAGAVPTSTAAGSSAQILVGQAGAPTWNTMSADATLSASAALTLASIITAGGPTGSATVVPVITWDAKGRLTAVTTTTISGVPPAAHNILDSSFHGDTLTGTVVLGDLIHGNATPKWAKLAGNTTTTRKFLRQTGDGALSAVPAWDTILAADIPGSALTKVDDTNVTLTLGGTPTTALLAAASLTLGWTGQLALTRGGMAASLTASNGGIFYSTASAGAILAGTATAGQILRSGATAAPTWSTATYPATAGTSGNVLTSDGTNWASSTIASLGFVTGTGTTEYVPYWSNGPGGVLGNSAIQSDGFYVDIIGNTLGLGKYLRVGYDSTSLVKLSVDNTALVAFEATGTGGGRLPRFSLNRRLSITDDTGSAQLTFGLAASANAVAFKTTTAGTLVSLSSTFPSTGLKILPTTPWGSAPIVDIVSATLGRSVLTVYDGDGRTIVDAALLLTANSFAGMEERTAPASAVGYVRGWADSTDHRFHDKNPSGVIGTTVVANTGAANNFLTAISTAGVISKARPDYADLTGTPTIPVGANPTGTIGTAAVNGSATTFLRSDGAPAFDMTIARNWTAGVHTFTAQDVHNAGVSLGTSGALTTVATSANVGFVITDTVARDSAIKTLTIENTALSKRIMDVTWDGRFGFGYGASGSTLGQVGHVLAFLQDDSASPAAAPHYTGILSLIRHTTTAQTMATGPYGIVGAASNEAASGLTGNVMSGVDGGVFSTSDTSFTGKIAAGLTVHMNRTSSLIPKLEPTVLDQPMTANNNFAGGYDHITGVWVHTPRTNSGTGYPSSFYPGITSGVRVNIADYGAPKTDAGSSGNTTEYWAIRGENVTGSLETFPAITGYIRMTYPRRTSKTLATGGAQARGMHAYWEPWPNTSTVRGAAAVGDTYFDAGTGFAAGLHQSVVAGAYQALLYPTVNASGAVAAGNAGTISGLWQFSHLQACTFDDAKHITFSTTGTGTKIGTGATELIGFWNVAPVVRPSAFTQTYATATKTHAAPVATAVATTVATNVVPFGYTTAAQADSLVTAINNLITDLANTKQVLNAAIDDLQSIGLLQ